MASLKEIKERINSVKSTLKITSAMKLMSSAKYHKFSSMMVPLKEYRDELQSCLNELGAVGGDFLKREEKDSARCCVVAISSNSSLCGGFNTNIIKKAKETLAESGENPACFFIGKKMCEAMAKSGFRSEKELNRLTERPNYKDAAELADILIDGYLSGQYSCVKLVYTHCRTTAHQECVVEEYLPCTMESGARSEVDILDRYFIEPDVEGLEKELLSKLLHLHVYTMLLDSCQSEHAARMIAMQTATDNGDNMLSELTLEYNKSRQAKITAEILDLAGGAQE